MGWFDGLVKNAQSFGGGIANAIRQPGNIQTPFSAGIAGQPQKKLTIGDIVPQLPQAYNTTTTGARNAAIGLAQGIARVPLNVGTSVAQMGATALQGWQGKGSKAVPMQINTAGNPILSALFGKDPIKSYQGTAQDTAQMLKQFGASKTQMGAATIPIAGVMASMDLLTGGKGKALTESLAKEGTSDGVRAILQSHFGDSAAKVPQQAVDAIAKETNPKAIAQMLKPGGITPAAPADAAMHDLHKIPLDDATRQQVHGELTAVGEHGAAAKVAQAQTHGDLVQALAGTQLHPDSAAAMHYALPDNVLPPAGTPLSHMDPAMMAHEQHTTADQMHKAIGVNDILTKKAVAQDPNTAALSTVKAGPVRAGNLMAGKMEQLQARAAAYQAKEAGLAKAELAAREQNMPSPAEMEASNANAQMPKPTKQQPVTGPVNLDKMLPTKEKAAPTGEAAAATPKQAAPKSEGMIPGKESGSAQENQGGYVGKLPTKANANPHEPVGYTGKLGDGTPRYAFHTSDKGENQIIDRAGQAGEILHSKKEGGDIYSRVYNQILDKAGTYGKGNRDPVKIWGGREKSGVALGKQLDAQIKKDLPNAADRELLTHHLEDPTVKVSEHVQRVADQVKPIRDISLHTRQAINPEVRGVENYMSHQVAKTPAKPLFQLRGATRKVSTFSTANQGRTMHMLEDLKTGDKELGSTEGMARLSDGKYKDTETGKVYQAHPATIKDFKKAGIPVEADAATILGKYVADTNRVKENSNLIDHLKTRSDVIQPGKPLTAGQQAMRYRTVNVKGLDGYRMPNKLAFQLEGAMKSGAGTNSLIKGYDTASRAVTNTIFYNMVTHPINMMTNFAVGSGSLSKFGPAGTVKALSQLKTANEALRTQNDTYIRLQNAGLHFGGFASSGKPSMLERLGTKLAGDMGAKIGKGVDNANLIKQFYRLNSKVIGFTDDHLKAALALAGEKKFGSLEASVKNADRFMVDYGNSTAFEKKVGSRVANFLPWVKGNLGAYGYMATNSKQNIGAITNLALMAATWYELQDAYKKYTGNPKANVRAPGMLGIGKDVITGARDITKGKVPSAATSHLNPLLREGASQIAGKDIGTGQPLEMKKGQTYTDANGKPYVYQGKNTNDRLTHAAGNLVAPLTPAIAVAKEKKSPTEVAMNQLGFNTPHKATEQAAPNIGAGQLLSGINTNKGGTKSAVDTAAAYKAAGGSKLLAYQIMRAGGDHSMDSFFSKAGNDVLDPLSKTFKGFHNQSGSSVSTGKDLFKQLGGSSLTYMQAQKLGGSSTYDTFFGQHPELNPTNPQFQGFNKSGGGSSSNKAAAGAKAMANAIKYQNYRGSSQTYKAKNAMQNISRKGTGAVKAPRATKAVRTVPLKVAKVKNLTPTRKAKVATV